jgi:hypothetical protein
VVTPRCNDGGKAYCSWNEGFNGVLGGEPLIRKAAEALRSARVSNATPGRSFNLCDKGLGEARGGAPPGLGERFNAELTALVAATRGRPRTLTLPLLPLGLGLRATVVAKPVALRPLRLELSKGTMDTSPALKAAGVDAGLCTGLDSVESAAEEPALPAGRIIGAENNSAVADEMAEKAGEAGMAEVEEE